MDESLCLLGRRHVKVVASCISYSNLEPHRSLIVSYERKDILTTSMPVTSLHQLALRYNTDVKTLLTFYLCHVLRFNVFVILPMFLYKKASKQMQILFKIPAKRTFENSKEIILFSFVSPLT